MIALNSNYKQTFIVRATLKFKRTVDGVLRTAWEKVDANRGRSLLVEVAPAHSPVRGAVNSIMLPLCHRDKKRQD